MAANPLEHPARRRLLAAAALAPALLSLAGLAACAGPWPPRPLQDRMDTLLDPACPGQCSGTLLVLLPGAYDTPQDFVRQGFVQAVRQRQLPLDLLLPDAHTGYYTSQQIVERLLHEVLQPAHAQGYRHIWLAGISLGGYGSLLLASRHAQHIDGIFLMAAFLGRRDLPAAIQQAGGLQAWDGQLPGADAHDLALWRWLRAHTAAAAPQAPQLWIGWGEQDRFAASNRLLGDALPPERVLRTPGGHDWPTWQKLWQSFLDAKPFQPKPSSSPCN